MRTFCTEGPVYPERNYFVSREDILALGLRKVDEWRYYPVCSPAKWQEYLFSVPFRCHPPKPANCFAALGLF